MNITVSAKKLLVEQLATLKALAANQFEWSAVFATERVLERVEAEPDSMLKLWFIKANHPDFEETDQDLLVWAVDVREATVIWREHFETELEAEPKSVKEVPMGAVGSGAVCWSKLT
jgi:hypothetical protein